MSDASDAALRDTHVSKVRAEGHAVLLLDTDADADADTDAQGCSKGPALCNDANDCTVDRVDEECNCIHEVVADGSPCSDSDVCTTLDQCRAGACVGTARKASPLVLGNLRSFGAAPGLATIVGFVAEDRAIVASGRTLALVEVLPQGVRVLDRAESQQAVQSSWISPLIWVDRPGTFILPLSSRRVALAGYQQGIDVYDTSSDRLIFSRRYTFPTFEGQIVGAVGSGDRIWTCSGAEIFGHAVDSATNQITKQANFALPQGHSCRSLALSPDQKTLLAATSGGLDLIDVSNADGTMSRTSGALEGTYLLNALATQNHIAAYKLAAGKQSNGSYFADNGSGDVVVLSRDTLSPIAEFKVNLEGTTPAGFTLTDNALLLQQTTKQADCRSIGAEFFELQSNSVRKVRALPLSNTCSEAVLPPLPLFGATRGNYAVLEPFHHFAAVDADSASIKLLSALEQGSFESVRAAGPDSVEVHSPISMHRVDLTNPAIPRIEKGGLLSQVNAEWSRLYVSERASFVTIADAQRKVTGAVTTLYWPSAEASLPVIEGSIANADAKGEWIAAGNHTYQLTPVGVKDFQLKRFAVSSFSRQEKQTLKVDWERTLSTQAPDELNQRKGSSFSVDESTGALLILEKRSGTDARSQRSVVSWFSATPDGYKPAFALPSEAAGDVGVHLVAGKGVIAFMSSVYVVDESGAKRATFALDSSTVSLDRLLAANANIVYLAATFKGTPRTKGVIVLRAKDLSEVARYPTPEPVLSVAEVGEHLVFGMKSTLVTASPACLQP